MKKSVFETLSAINVNDKVEKKNGLTYLSWAWAWGEVKKAYPSAVYEVARDPQTDKPYFADPDLGIMVMTNVCIDSQCLEMWLPVMNHRNQALTVDQATMFDVNKAIMRCLTKNLAMFGLGHYIYVGEDYPQTGLCLQDTPRRLKSRTSLTCVRVTPTGRTSWSTSHPTKSRSHSRSLSRW